MDVTHGFRTFPLLAQQVVFYLKEVSSKNIKFRNFYYGMLDAIRDLKYAPVVDLKIMFEMNDWIIGANIFKTSMNGSKIVSLIKKKDENLAKMLDEFSKALNINYAYDIQQQIEILKDFDTSEIGNPEKLIVDKILKDFVGHFSNINKHSCFQFDLAKWYYEKNNYGNAYVILTESIITLICEKFDNNPFQKENRNKAKSYLSQINKKSSNELAYLSAIYSNLVTIRNNISHNLQKRPNMYLDDIGQLSNFFKLLKKYF
jgi:CRISPR-associated DxTHG motif protein